MNKIFSLYIHWDPSPSVFSWNLPLLGRPILWYGVLFAFGFFLAYLLFQKLLKEQMGEFGLCEKDLPKIQEQVGFHVVLGTILGAKLGEALFYQRLIDLVHHPLDAMKFWEGGLSSHGAVIGILTSLWILSLRYVKKGIKIPFVSLVELLTLPALLAGGFIRIGNFVNQEIVGKITSVPWAIVFEHPASFFLTPLPRHPVQLYEACAYFGLCFILFWLKKNSRLRALERRQHLGIFFITMFTARFGIEFLKEPQSIWFQTLNDTALHLALNMGQILSLPFIFFGGFLFLRGQKSSRVQPIERD